MQEHGEADEARIAALFRDAASGAPPPGFDATQVVATSRRITRRRRSAVAGAALAVLAVVGVGVVAGLGGPSDTTVTAASGQAADSAASGPGAGSEGAARAAAPEAAAPDAAGSPLAPSAAEPVPARRSGRCGGAADRCPARPRHRRLRGPAGPGVAGARRAGAARGRRRSRGRDDAGVPARR